jgi:hypothetical protein
MKGFFEFFINPYLKSLHNGFISTFKSLKSQQNADLFSALYGEF